MASQTTKKRSYSQLETPKKNRIIGAAQFAASKGLKYTRKDLATEFKVTTNQVDYALKSTSQRTQKASEIKAENHKILSERDLDRVEAWLENADFDGHALNWDELAINFDLPITGQTLQQRFNQRNIFSFVACDKPWIPEKQAAKRVDWCKTMLQRYPNPEDWHHVRFSDEVHFGWGPEGKIRVIRPRRGGERGRPSNIQRKEVRDDGTSYQKRVHFWGAVGHGFKVQTLTQYEVPGNSNGKMNQEVYINEILQKEVATWKDDPRRWCLEEDGDSGHGTTKPTNRVEKAKIGLGISREIGDHHTAYFNHSHSPDLSIVEDVWSYPKIYVKRRPHWDDEMVADLVQEAWAQIPQDWIDRLANSMPQRLRDCIESEGQFVQMR